MKINRVSFERIKIKVSEDERPIFKSVGTVKEVKKQLNGFLKEKYGR
jgi:hypothetical protein